MKRLAILVFLLIVCSAGYAQPGKLGNVTISGAGTVVNTYSAVTANIAAGSSNITVNNIATDLGGLSAGDLILIYQAQGANIQTTDDNNYGTITSYNSAGLFEYAYVVSTSGNTITVGCNLKNAYSTAGKTQVVKVPLYNNLTINSGGSIAASKWNGAKGGIVAIHVKVTLTNNGVISAVSAGFRGGKRDNLTSAAGAGIVTIYRSGFQTDGAEKGESIAGYQADYDAAGMGGRYGRGAPANGGGGGNGHNAAGGGGANGNNGLAWTGAGVMDPNPLYTAAWQLDPDYVSNGNQLTNSSGGGRGGYTFAANNVNAFTTPLSNAAWGGDYRDAVGGRGGRPLSSDVEKRIFLGGGGGAGDGNNNASNDGGDGGGIVYIISNTIAGTGTISVQGQNGLNTTPSHNDAPGGGGGGGSIVVKAFNFTGQTLNANGGSGGNQLIVNDESEGCGGGGGGGFIAVPTGGAATCGVSNSYTYIYGTNGTSTSASVTEFPPNGGTWGATGQNDVPVSPYFMPYTLTCLIDNDVDAVGDPVIDIDDDNDGITDIDESFSGIDPSADHDSDYAPNYADPSFVPYLDANCDGINDYFDFDLDGVPDFIDLDSDNDGITDCLEAGGTDANKDGIIDGFVDANADGLSDPLGSGLTIIDIDGDGRGAFRDRDADGDGIYDIIEAGGTDANTDGIIDSFADTDKDGYANAVDPTTDRLALTGANPSGSTPLTVADSDGDSKRNFLDTDSDNDGITDNVEAQTTAGYRPPVNADSDNDGIANLYDITGGTPITLVNTDGADVADYLDADSDNDGVSDAIEGNDANADGNPSPSLPVSGDADGDGLLDAYDLVAGVNNTVTGMAGTGSSSPVQDTDGDGARDWRDTDDDGDCVLTSATGASGENANSNTLWSDDFTQGGAPIPNYLFAANNLTVTGASRCGNGTVILDASSTGTGIFNWYSAASGGSPLLTTASSSSSAFTTPSLTTTTTYYVEFDNGICVTSRKPVTATIVSGSSTPAVTAGSRCGTGTVTLEASASSTGTFRWYTAASGGTLLQTTASALSSNYTTPSISITTTYYVEFDNGTCTSGRAAVAATVQSVPSITVTNGNSCGAPTAALSASASASGTFNWYDAATGGILLSTQNSVSSSTYTPAVSTTTTYYVEFSNGSCITARTAVTANVVAGVTAPSVTNNTICTTGTTTLSASHTTSGTFRWYSVASGGSPLQTNAGVTTSNFNTPSISASTNYYVEYSNGTCTSARIQVTAYVVAGSISVTNGSRCGTGGVSLAASSAIAGTFNWYAALTGGSALFTSPTNVTSSNYITPSISANTTYYVTLTTSSPACAATTPRVAVTATVGTSVTLAGTGATVCNPGTVGLSASSGGVTGTFRWYAASVGGTPLLTTTAATSSNFTTPFISTTTDYYVEFDQGTCVTSRIVVRAAVISTTDITVTDGSRCGTGTVGLLANSLTAGVFNWYLVSSGGVSQGNSGGAAVSSYSFTSPSISATTTYYIDITTASPACTSLRVPIVATVLPAATAPTAINGSRCGTGSVVISASSAVSGIIQWYDASSGGNLLQTDNTTTLSTFTTPSISATTTYYAQFGNGTCTSSRTAVTATVTTGAAPAAPSATAASRCGTGSVTLNATSASSGVFRWWTAATGGTVLQTTTAATASSFVTPSISATTTYYVDFDNGTCVTSSRSAVIATINSLPAAPAASDAERCGTGTINLTATSATSGIFRWYAASSGGSPLLTSATGTSSTYSPSISASTTYYVEFDNTTCTSAARTPVIATMNIAPTAPTATPGSGCGTGSVILGASSSAPGTFRWYAASSGGSALSTTTASTTSSFTTPSISSNTTYYVEFDNGTCISTRTSVFATVITAPAAPSITNGSHCETGTVNLAASSASSGSFRWYTSASGGTLLETDASTTTSSFTTPSLTSTQSYYVEFFNGTCASARVAVVATINPVPQINSVTSGCTGIASNGTIAISASVAAGTLEYSTNGTTYQASNSFTGLANGTYTVYAREIASLCVISQPGVTIQCNVPPTVSNKTVSVNEDNVLMGDVTTGADSDPDGTAITVTTTPVSGPSNGGIVLNADGTYTYTPNNDFNGTDIITFEVCDAGTPMPAACITRTLTITVDPLNDAPVAVNDPYSTNEDVTLTIATVATGVLNNDTDTEGSALTTVIGTTTTNGTLTLNANGTFTYVPNANFNGTDSFTYSANDGTTNSTLATVTITVNPVNDAPVAVNDPYSTNEDVTLTIATVVTGVLNNDTDTEGSALTTVIGTTTTNGTLTLNANGTFTYVPNANFNGTDSFTYRANDGTTNSALATVTITVNPANDAPVAVNDPYSTNEDVTLTISTVVTGVLNNDTDIDGDALTTVIGTTTTNGTLTLNANGTFTYVPNANFNGTDSFTYRANDGTTNSALATVTITVNPVNDAPVAVNDPYSTNEDVTLTIATVATGVLNNDTDTEGSALTTVIGTTTTNGTLTLNANGTFTYVPNANFNGTDSFTYRANDGTTNSALATVTITVNPANDAPVAVNDPYSTNEDVTLTISTVVTGVLNNDTDIDGDALTTVISTTTTNGTLTLNANGTFTYVPNANFNGTDSFTYRANDGTTNSALATVTITVNPVNDAPVAVNDPYSTNEDVTLTIATVATGVLNNDTDTEGSALTTVIGTTTTNGTLALNANGTFTYVPNANFNGTDSFTYSANDGTTNSALATVTITVNPVNDAPVAVNDPYSTNEDVTLNVSTVATGVLNNDTDTEGSALTTVIGTTTTNGTLTLNANGTFTYVPNANFNGTDSFTYSANDGTTNSALATVTITVNPVNDAPVAVNDPYSTNEDVTLTIATVATGVLNNDTDTEGSALTTVIGTTTTNGTLTLNANGTFTYVPNANFNGTDSFTYRANDGTTNSALATVTITVNPVNDAPVAVNDPYSTNEDVTLTIATVATGVLNNDTDTEGSALTTVIGTTTTNGTLTLNANGTFTYVPNANFNGTDSFTYRANDGTTNSALATVTITVNPVNDAPVAVNDPYSTNEDVTLNVSTVATGVLNNDTDTEGSALTTVIVTTTTNGTLTLNANGTFTYVPNANFNGTDSFTYSANDGTTNSALATVTITVNPVNDAPVAVNDPYSTNEDVTLTIATVATGVLNNDTDTEGSALTTVIGTTTTNGTLTLNANGTFTYVPNANFNGTDSFTYNANDGTTNSALATVTITVNPVNDAPVAVNDPYSTNEDVTLTIATVATGVLNNDTDVEGSPLTVSLGTTTTNGTLTLNANGTFTYVPNANFNGTDSFTYSANDGTTNSALATVTITVNPVNDAPVAVNDPYSTNEDVTLTIATVATGVLNNDTDTEGSALTTVIGTTTTNGILTLNANGTFTYVPNANFNGTDSFTYRANDGTTNSAVATVTITVNPVNDAPVAVNDPYSTNEDVTLNVSTVATGVLNNDTDTEGSALTTVIGTTTTNGTLTLNANGTFTYVPNANFNGTDSFTYRANDGTTNSALATVTITVNPVNDAPVAVNDPYSTNEDVTLTIATVATGVLNNDTDTEGSSLTTVIGTTTTNGTLTLNANGTFTYVPNASFNGTDAFTYQVNDGTATSALATVTITVNPVNDAPVAVNDSYSTNEDATLTISTTATGVLNNDTDIESNPVTATIGTTTGNGTLTLNADGTFIYVPNAGFNGSDAFTYTISDGTASSAIATVNITVNPVNDVPVAVTDAYSTNEDIILAITTPATGVLNNDTDAEGSALTVVLGTTTINGTLTLNADGTFTYVPNIDFNGSDSFTYSVSDGTDSSAPVTVTITVTGVNDAPLATVDNASTPEETVVTVNLASNDSDVDGTVDATSVDLDPATPGQQTTFSNTGGAWSVDNTALVTFTPSTNFNGNTSISYTVNDNNGAVSNIATLTVTITGTNDAPVAADNTTITPEETAVTFNIVADDTDTDGTIDITTVDLDPATPGQQTIFSNQGIWSVDNAGIVTYTPAADFNGNASIAYTVNDNGAVTSNTGTVTITVTGLNDAPAALADNATTTEEGVVTISVTANDTDVDGTIDVTTVDLDPVTPGLQTTISDSNGAWRVDNTGIITFTPVPDFTGTATITYVVGDNSGAISNVANVTVLVTPVNDPPVLGTISSTISEDNPLNGNVFIPGDNDPEGTQLVVNITPVSGPAHGTITINADGTFNYIPAGNSSGTDAITIEICDSNSPAACTQKTILITVTPVNDAPVVNNDQVATFRDVPVSGSLASNDVDIEGDPLIYNVVPAAAPAHGTFVMAADGSYTYTPEAGFVGTDEITIEVCDSSLPAACTTQTLTIEISADITIAPLAKNDSIGGPVMGIISLNVTSNDVRGSGEIDPNTVDLDPSVEGIQQSLVLPGQGTVTVSSDGVVSFVPDAGFAGTATISYTVNDANGNTSNVAEIQITIQSSLPVGTVVPNAFSPNGDGENDVFIIEGAEQYQVSLHVYNRWGNIVYASDNYKNTWSGFSMNVQDSRNPSRISVSKEQSELPDGTYFYFIEFAGADSKRYSGFVELRR